MIYNFNGIEIELKDKVCQLWDYKAGDIEPQANLYIRVTNKCNANCKYCKYHGEEKDFNWNKTEQVLKELKDRDIIYKIQLTGGEPSTFKELKELCIKIRKYFPNTFISINTNGYNLGLLVEINEYVDNYAISRHHYKDETNKLIFDTDSIPSTEELKQFIHKIGKDKIHFSCNLMKSGINNLDEIKKYSDYIATIGGCDIGLVTLMNINKYCEEEQIVFDTTGIDESYEFLKYKQFQKEGNCCKCANYLYHSKATNKLVDLYGRFVIRNNKTVGLLSFDGETLREGFNGQIIL